MVHRLFYSQIIVLAITVAIMMLMNQVNVDFDYWVQFVYLVLSVLFFKQTTKSECFHSKLKITFLILCSFFALGFLSSKIWDLSFDGQGFHRLRTQLLTNDWHDNYYEGQTGTYFNDVEARVINENPAMNVGYHWGPRKLAENNSTYLARALFGKFLFYDIEATKIYNLFLIILASVVGYQLATAYGLSRYASWAICLLWALNPATLCQLFTFSMDSNVASLISIVFGLSLLLLKNYSHLILCAFVSALFLLFTAKVSGPIYCFLAICFLILCLLNRSVIFKRYKEYFLLVLLLLIVGGGYGAYHYLGEDRSLNLTKKVMDRYLFDLSMIEEFTEMAIPTRFMHSLFNQNAHGGYGLYPKIPLMVYPREVKMHTKLYQGSELGGWGPWMSAAVVIAFLILMYLIFVKKDEAPLVILAVLIFAYSILAPSGHWARLNPLFSLFPVVVLLLCMSQNFLKKFFLKKALAVTLLFNLLLVSFLHLYGQANLQWAARRQLECIAELKQPVYVRFANNVSLEDRFKKYDIEYVPMIEIPNARSVLPLIHTNYEVLIGVNPDNNKSRIVLRDMQILQELLRKRWVTVYLEPLTNQAWDPNFDIGNGAVISQFITEEPK